jgi:hypothetical protein
MLTLKSARRALVAAAIALPMTVILPADPAGAAPLGSCGLGKKDMGSFWHYSVRNCHDVAVNRRVVFNDSGHGECRHYEPGQQKRFESEREPMSLIQCD